MDGHEDDEIETKPKKKSDKKSKNTSFSFGRNYKINNLDKESIKKPRVVISFDENDEKLASGKFSEEKICSRQALMSRLERGRKRRTKLFDSSHKIKKKKARQTKIKLEGSAIRLQQSMTDKTGILDRLLAPSRRSLDEPKKIIEPPCFKNAIDKQIENSIFGIEVIKFINILRLKFHEQKLSKNVLALVEDFCEELALLETINTWKEDEPEDCFTRSIRVFWNISRYAKTITLLRIESEGFTEGITSLDELTSFAEKADKYENCHDPRVEREFGEDFKARKSIKTFERKVPNLKISTIHAAENSYQALQEILLVIGEKFEDDIFLGKIKEPAPLFLESRLFRSIKHPAYATSTDFLEMEDYEGVKKFFDENAHSDTREAIELMFYNAMAGEVNLDHVCFCHGVDFCSGLEIGLQLLVVLVIQVLEGYGKVNMAIHSSETLRD